MYSHRGSGVYLNLVEGLLWVQDVERSNRFTPTTMLVKNIDQEELCRTQKRIAEWQSVFALGDGRFTSPDCLFREPCP